LGVEFKVEVSLGESADGTDFLYDDPAALYDTATYSTGEIDWTDLSAVLEGFTCERGRDHLGQEFRPGLASITLSNESGIFNPFVSGQQLGALALRPGRWVRISGKRSDEDEWSSLWVGRIESMLDVYEDAAHRITSSWSCSGLLSFLEVQAPPPLEVIDPATVGQFPTERAEYLWDILGFDDAFLNIDTSSPDDNAMIGTTFPGSRLSQFNQAAAVRMADFYADRDGILQFTDKQWLSKKTVVDFNAGDGSNSLELLEADSSWDAHRVQNEVSVQNEGGVAQIAISSQSQALYGIRSYAEGGLQAEQDAAAFERAEWLIDRNAYNTQRIDSISLWASEIDDVNTLLQVDIGDLVRVTVETGQGWSYTLQAFVNKVRHVVTADDWQITLRLDNQDRSNPLNAGAYSTAYNEAYQRKEP